MIQLGDLPNQEPERGIAKFPLIIIAAVKLVSITFFSPLGISLIRLLSLFLVSSNFRISLNLSTSVLQQIAKAHTRQIGLKIAASLPYKLFSVSKEQNVGDIVSPA